MSILIGADFVSTNENIDAFVRGKAEGFLGPRLRKLLAGADYRIFNLEVPLTNRERPIPKCGPNLSAPTAAANGYRSAGVNLLSLANNHILDQGEDGLSNTLFALQEQGIAWLGAGKTSEEAAKPYEFSCFGKRIGVYACVEHEFSVAMQERAGANPFDSLYTPDHVATLKMECDYVIVLYHGGKERYRYPSPELQRTCRRLVEKGADLVLCQHSHIIGCEERFNSGVIVYGQGNFLFGKSADEGWHSGLLVCLDETFSVSYLPVTVSVDGVIVELAEQEEAEKQLKEFYTRSKEIARDGFVEEAYRRFADLMQATYLKAFSGRESKLFKILNRISGNRLRVARLRQRYSRSQKLAIQNYVACEAHRELLLKGLMNETES